MVVKWDSFSDYKVFSCSVKNLELFNIFFIIYVIIYVILALFQFRISMHACLSHFVVSTLCHLWTWPAELSFHTWFLSCSIHEMGLPCYPPGYLPNRMQTSCAYLHCEEFFTLFYHLGYGRSKLIEIYYTYGTKMQRQWVMLSNIKHQVAAYHGALDNMRQSSR